MQNTTREELIAQIERGDFALRDVAGLSPDDIRVLEHVGRVAFETGRYDKASKIFAGLEALEPDRPEHILRRAYAEAEAGRGQVATMIVSRYLDREAQLPAGDLTRALLLRAQLLIETNREAARADLAFATVLAERSPEAKSVLEGKGR